MLENETNPIIFSCQAVGEPIPAIIWYFNGAMINISDASKYRLFNISNGTVITSALAIENAESPDVGTYTCYAENIIGSDRSSGILTINGMCVFPYVIHV